MSPTVKRDPRRSACGRSDRALAGDYPGNDFAITEDGVVRRVVHLPTGMTIVTKRASRDPIAVSSAYTVEVEGSGSHYPQEVAQAALRHLRVWLMRKYGHG
jgi:hypothetical protein